MNIFILFIIAFVVLANHSTASPLVESRDENPAWWLNILESGADAIKHIPDLFETPESTTPAPESPNEPAPAAPDFKILPSNTPKTQQEGDQQNPQAPPLTATDCDPNSSASSGSSCRTATSQIIYPRKCEQGDALTLAINDVIRPKVVKRFIDNRCGVSFYSASLTQVEKSEISKLKNVKIVATNRKIDGPRILKNPDSPRVPNDQNYDSKPDKSSKNGQKTDGEDSITNNEIAKLSDQSDQIDFNDDATPPSLRKKRAVIDFVTERPDSIMGNLAFISTPINRKLTQRYLSFRRSGHGARLYLMCPGVDSTHRTFIREPFQPVPGGGTQNARSEGIIKSQLNAIGSSPFGIIDDDYVEGTCAASIAIGDPFGVTLYSDLVIVKITNTVESYLDAWLQILNDLGDQGRLNPQRPLEGYTVIETHQSWFRSLDLPLGEQLDLMAHEDQVKQYLSSLITDWQVVVVVPAASEPSSNNIINRFPAVLSVQEDLPIIVAGAVKIDGSAEAFSPGGPALTVSAPNRAGCAGLNGEDELQLMGTLFAAAHVSGLALYLLSLDGLGAEIRARRPVATTLRDFMLYKAYRRQDGWPVAIWNGLDPFEPGSYGWEYMGFFQGRKKS